MKLIKTNINLNSYTKQSMNTLALIKILIKKLNLNDLFFIVYKL